jgi:hypothetical protein
MTGIELLLIDGINFICYTQLKWDWKKFSV